MLKDYYYYDPSDLVVNPEPYQESNPDRLPFKTYLTEAPLPPREGYVVCVKLGETKTTYYKKNHKGEVAYNTETDEEVIVDYYGDLKLGFTLNKRPNEFFIYDKYTDTWVVDDTRKEDYIDYLKKQACLEIDSVANVFYNRWSNKSEPYMVREQEANAYIEAYESGDTEVVPGGLLKGYADPANVSYIEAAYTVRGQGIMLRSLIEEIENQRMRKGEVRNVGLNRRVVAGELTREELIEQLKNDIVSRIQYLDSLYV